MEAWASFRWRLLEGVPDIAPRAFPLLLERYLAAGGAWTSSQKRAWAELMEDKDIEPTALVRSLAHLDPQGLEEPVGWLRRAGAQDWQGWEQEGPHPDNEGTSPFARFLSAKGKHRNNAAILLMLQLQKQQAQIQATAWTLEQLQVRQGAMVARVPTDVSHPVDRRWREALPLMKEALGTQTAVRIRSEILHQIARVDHPQAIEVLGECLQEDLPFGLQEATLRGVIDQESLRAPALLEAAFVRLGQQIPVRSQKNRKECEAWEGLYGLLGSLGSAGGELVDRWIDALEGPLPELWPMAVQALAEIEPTALDKEQLHRMLQRLEHTDGKTSTCAAMALSHWQGLSLPECEELYKQAHHHAYDAFRRHLFLPMASCANDKIRGFLWSILHKQDRVEEEEAFKALLMDAQRHPEGFEPLWRWARQQNNEAWLNRLLLTVGCGGVVEMLESLETYIWLLPKEAEPTWETLWSLACLKSPLCAEWMERLFRDQPRRLFGPTDAHDPLLFYPSTVVEEMGYAASIFIPRVETLLLNFRPSSLRALNWRYALSCLSFSDQAVSSDPLSAEDRLLLLFWGEQKAHTVKRRLTQSARTMGTFLHLRKAGRLLNGMLLDPQAHGVLQPEVWRVLWQRMRNHFKILNCHSDPALFSMRHTLDGLCERLLNLAPYETLLDYSTRLQEALYS
ncbi:hypothetical protein L6R29_20975 [Myxococcota bacterium]|nr:hypothetical protein [Myxococcota bacterium]